MPAPNLNPSAQDSAKLIARVERLERNFRGLGLDNGLAGAVSFANSQEILKADGGALTGASTSLEVFSWAHSAGGNLLDTTTPERPTVNDAGLYSVHLIHSVDEGGEFFGFTGAEWPAPYPPQGSLDFAILAADPGLGFGALFATADIMLTAYFNAGDEFRFTWVAAVVGSPDPGIHVRGTLIVTKLG